VTRDQIELIANDKQEVIDYGIAVWSTGEALELQVAALL
jgi:hypothetical protein